MELASDLRIESLKVDFDRLNLTCRVSVIPVAVSLLRLRYLARWLQGSRPEADGKWWNPTWIWGSRLRSLVLTNQFLEDAC